MGDPRRFDVFAEFLSRNFPKESRVADVAGGKGYLQSALRERGFDSVITYDKRRGRKDRPKMRYHYGFFDENTKGDFDLLVGMHPDEATDVIIREAAKRKANFAIVPCCVKPTVSGYWGNHNMHDWNSHLIRYATTLGASLRQTELRINGRRLVIYGGFR